MHNLRPGCLTPNLSDYQFQRFYHNQLNQPPPELFAFSSLPASALDSGGWTLPAGLPNNSDYIIKHCKEVTNQYEDRTNKLNMYIYIFIIP